MGNPPRPMLIRKLVKRFFKRHNPPPSVKASEYKSKLFDCWQHFGIGHPKCEPFVPAYDLGWGVEMSEKAEVQQLMKEYPRMVYNEFAVELNRNYFRGKKGLDKNATYTKGRPWRV